MLSGKRARLLKSASKQSEEEKTTSIITIFSNDVIFLHSFNSFINYSIKFLKLVKPSMIGFLVILYSLHQIESKIILFLSYTSKLELINIILLTFIVICLKFNGYYLINCFNNSYNSYLKEERSSVQNQSRIVNGVLNFLSIVKKTPNLLYLCITLVLFMFTCVIFIKTSYNFKAQYQEQTNLFLANRQQIINNAFFDKSIKSMKENEQLKLITYYDRTFNKLNKLQKILKQPVGKKCYSRNFYQSIMRNITDKKLIKNLILKARRKTIFLNKLENISLCLFPKIFLIYSLLLLIYFIFHKINKLSTIYNWKKKNTKFIDDIPYNRKHDVSKSNLSNNYSFDYVENNEELHKNLFKKYKPTSLKKVLSLLSLKSENIKVYKHLQKLQIKNSETETTNDFVLIKWFINQIYKELFVKMNLVLMNSINDYARCIVS